MKALHDMFEDDIIFEMSNLNQRITGLQHGYIFISSSYPNKIARIKYYESMKGKNVSITIENNPKILIGDTTILTGKHKKQVFKFISINKKILLKYWNDVVGMDSDQVNKLLDKLKKV